MKKTGILIGVIALAGATIVGISSSKKVKVANAIDLDTYFEMNSDFFTNWTNDAGSFANKDATFWGEGYHFEALDTFFRGESAEGWTGTLTSVTWKQQKQYVYFTWGGARDVDDKVRLVFHFGEYESSI